MAQDLTQWSPEAAKDLMEINACLEAVKNSPIYKKHGPEGTWQVLAMAKTLNINPLQALNRDLYAIKGKIEMTAQCMNNLIRRGGHSVTKDPQSTKECVILHGKRADTGDTWTCSYSVKEAEQAGLCTNIAWKRFPEDMCFNRALSRLARQLFPDVIAGCYIEGEIRDAPPLHETEATHSMPVQEAVVVEYINQDQVKRLYDALNEDPDPSEALDRIEAILQTDDLEKVPADRFESLMKWLDKRQQQELDAANGDDAND